jgi:AcrR family transcriptional regulator
MPRRKRLELDERRSQLLSLAQAAFASSSYDEVSIDDLARAAGVSKGLLYHYFPSKRELYLATVREAAERLLARIVPEPELSPFEQALRGVDAYLRYVRENADAYVSLMQSGVGRDEEVFALVEGTRHRFVEMILDRAGAELLSPLQRSLVHGWVGMVEAACLDWLKRPEVERAELAKLLVKTLLFALSASGGGK